MIESRGVKTVRPPRPVVVSRLGMTQMRLSMLRVAESRRDGCGTGIDT
jgi:hypothetical protein